MWYHAGIQFDYVGFSSEARSLAKGVINGDISYLYAKVNELTRREEFRKLFYQYGFGQVTAILPSIEEVVSSPDKNQILGQWFCWILIQYLKPSPISIGYNWRNIYDSLPLLGWTGTDIDQLINGMPVGLLLGEQVMPKRIVEKKDPYWYWIRPSYSFNQGGYLSVENINRLLFLLSETDRKVSTGKLNFPLNLHKDQEQNWSNHFTWGLGNAIAWLETAKQNNVGTYSAIYWEWEEVENF